MQHQMHHGRGSNSLLEVCSRRKWAGALVFGGVVTAVVSMVLSLPNLYRATATVLIQRQEISESFVRPSVTGELDTRLQTISQEIMSRARLQDLITRFNLYPDLRQRLPPEALVERMRRDIQLALKEVEGTGGRNVTIAFTLSYRGRDPQTVARVTNALASSYVEENLKIRERQAGSTTAFLKGQLLEAQQKLDEQERRINDFKLRHSDELPQQVGTNLALLERLNSQLRLNNDNQTRATDRREKILEQLAEGNSGGRVEVPDAPVARLAKLKVDLAQLRARYTDQHPTIIRLKEEIASLEQQLATRMATGTPAAKAAAAADPALQRLRPDLSKVDAEIHGLKQEERQLLGEIANYERRIDNAPKRQQELKEASRGYEVTKDLYESLLKRYQDAQLAESVEMQQQGQQFRILDAAIPPEAPAGPNRLRLMLMGVMLAFGLAAGAVAGVERLDTSFHSVGDLRAFTRVPVLVSIPPIVTAADLRRRRRRFCLGMVAAFGVLVLIAGVSRYIASGNEQLVWILNRGGA